MVNYDIHTHSSYSTDSDTPLSSQIRAAKKKGLSGICITDHMDYDFPPDIACKDEKNPFTFDEKAYKKELEQCRESMPDIWIGTGVECGIQTTPSVISKLNALTNAGEWDYIIGSVHLLDGKDPYFPEFWEDKASSVCVRHYFETMLQCLHLFSNFDSLGHMDYIVRYAPKDFVYEPRDYFDITDEIMKLIIKKDIALEVNASGLFSDVNRENPHQALLSRYTELGGEYITIGSDAHKPERIAGGFSTLEQHIKAAGLRQYVTFHKRSPVFHDL